jgi:hypothetical protein
MNFKVVACLVAGAAVALGFPAACAADGEVTLALSNNAIWLKVDGDRDDDWWLETSTNLTAWTTLTSLGTLLSGNETNAHWRSAGTKASGPGFYRARQTDGLYDPSLFRTVSLVYTQASATAFTNAMDRARQYETNVYLPQLWLNNGATNYHVGARFKGNSSYQMGGARKSINVEFDYITTNADLMGFETVNLNNAAGDETVMREPLFFNVMRQYTPCPRGAMCQLYANGALWSVYSLVQQENNELIKEWFPSTSGDRWRAPNAAAGGGMGFVSSNSAFIVFTNRNAWFYTNHYLLKSTSTNTLTALQRLTNAIYVLNLTPTNQLRDKAEDAFAVDNWLWMLAIENIFVDDDSYWNKGADYGFYYEPESGRIHPVEHDGNEAFTVATGINYNLSPVEGATGKNRPLLYRWLPINELRQRYLAHLRTVLTENFNPGVMTPQIDAYHKLSINAIIADPRKGITMAAYTNDLVALKTYITNRYNYLSTHAELTPLQPNITAVTGPTNVHATDTPFITAAVAANGTSGLGSVWLYHRGKPYGKFTQVQMLDDGVHGDGLAGNGIFGAATTNYAAGTKVRYYIEARGANAAQAARFSPARAEQETHSYRVGVTTAANSPVVINEVMASNTSTLADPQGEYDDWIELRNLTSSVVDLSGRYLSDEPNNPRKWQFPTGTTIPADGYLLVWADEDTTMTPGLHASFKLSGDGEEIYLTDTDSTNNQILDAVVFGSQTTDVSYGRSDADADVWTTMSPTPGADNHSAGIFTSGTPGGSPGLQGRSEP